MKARKWLLKNNYTRKIIAALFASLLAAAALTWFIKPANLLTSGATGLSLAIGRLFDDAELGFDIAFILINAPLLGFAYWKLGKKFTMFTALYTFMIIVWRRIFAGMDHAFIHQPLGDDRLLAMIFGFSLFALALTTLYKNNISSGGTNIVVYYISKIKAQKIGKISLYILVSTVLVSLAIESIKDGISLFDSVDERLGYTLLGLYLQTTLVDKIYPKYQKFAVDFVTQDPDKLIKAFKAHGYSRTFTKYNSFGIKRNIASKTLDTVCLYYELDQMIKIAKHVEPKVFYKVTRVHRSGEIEKVKLRKKPKKKKVKA